MILWKRYEKLKITHVMITFLMQPLEHRLFLFATKALQIFIAGGVSAVMALLVEPENRNYLLRGERRKERMLVSTVRISGL
jgi:hypothetical protein